MITLVKLWKDDKEYWRESAFIQNPRNETSFEWKGEEYDIYPVASYTDIQALCADKNIVNLRLAFDTRLAVDLTNPAQPRVMPLKDAPKPVREELRRRLVNTIRYQEDFDALSIDQQKLFNDKEKAKITENTTLRDEGWNAAISTEKERLSLVEKYNTLTQFITETDIGDERILVWNAQRQVLKEKLGLD